MDFLLRGAPKFVNGYMGTPKPTCKLQQPATLLKSNTLPWVFYTFLKLYKWYQIAQNFSFMFLDPCSNRVYDL